MPLVGLVRLKAGTRLACLLTWSGSGTSGEPTAYGVRSVSAWCSRSIHVVHIVADLRDTTVPVQDGTGTEICNANCACANRWIVPLRCSSSSYMIVVTLCLNHRSIESKWTEQPGVDFKQMLATYSTQVGFIGESSGKPFWQ